MRNKIILFASLMFLTFIPSFAQDNLEKWSFIDQLKNGEKYTIEIDSWGCFGGELGDMITVFKKQNQYYTIFNGVTEILTTKEVHYFKVFENQLSQNDHSGDCTSVDTYTLRYNDKTVNVSDGSCTWNGVYGLKKKLGWLKK